MSAAADQTTVVRIQLPASLTLDGAREVMAWLSPELQRGSGEIVIDATSLEHFDSSALAVLIECQRTAGRRSEGAGLRIEGAPRTLRELARLYGLTELNGLGGAELR